MDENRSIRARWREEIIPLAIVVLLAAWYFFSFFNRFAGLRSGDGEFGGGIVFLAGRRPYRDYFTAGPPLNQLKGALELALFGKALIVTRIMAVLERLVIAGVLYAWLRRSFSATAAMLASLVAIIVSAGDRTDPLASYNHDAILLAMLCGFAISLSLDRARKRTSLLLALSGGIAAGLSFLTKQTVGGAAMVAMLVFVSIAMARLHGLRRSFAWIAIYLAGFAATVACMALYLWRLGVLRACITMLFVSGPKAKASHPFVFLTREIMIAHDNSLWLFLGVLGLLFSGAAIGRAALSPSPEKRMTGKQWLIVMLGCVIVIGTAELLAYTSLPALQDFGKASVYYAFLGCALLGIAGLVLALRRKDRTQGRIWQIALFAALSWSVAASLSLSWPAFEAMTLPGLGLLLAATFDGAHTWGRRFLCLVMAAMVFIQVREKLDEPFSFDHQDEAAIRFATVPSREPALRGMRLPPETVHLIDDTLATIRQHSGPHDTIFTYPEMGIFYALSGHYAPTLADSHNIDVVQDSLARADAIRLLHSQPAVIIYARPTEANMRSDERLWRGGHLSGQRTIVAALDSMVPYYRLVGSYQLLPQDNPIQIYVRKPEAAHAAGTGTKAN